MIGRTNAGLAPLRPKYSIKGWCATIGLAYADLSDITEPNMRILMSKHASVDYFMEWYASDNAMLDMFTVNESAMKWIGQNDYICDKLLAISDAESRLLASEFWKYILKDHVPIMTSATAPYGEVKASSVYSTSYDGYMAFDDSDDTQWSASVTSNAYIGYKFTNPICVKRITILYRANRINNYRIEASNDGFVNDIRVVKNGTLTETSGIVSVSIDVDDNSYNMEYHLFIVDGHEAGGYLGRIGRLQFYGRSLNVSVPTMTSNTQPYGEAICGSVTTESTADYEAYKAFDKTDAYWHSGGGAPRWIGYDFGHDVCVKEFTLYDQLNRIRAFNLEGRKSDGTWEIVESYTYSGTVTMRYSVADLKHYPAWRINVTSATASVCVRELQFYGVDYSDRTERTYLYDHGVELVPWGCDSTVRIINNGRFFEPVPFIKNANEMVSAQLTDVGYNSTVIITDNAIDMTPYVGIRANIKYKGYDGSPVALNISQVNEPVYVDVNQYYYGDGKDNINFNLTRSRTNLLASASLVANRQVEYVHDKASLVYVEEIWLE